MQILLQIIGATIQIIGAMGLVFISLPSILAIMFHGGKTSLFSIGFVIIGTLISVIFMFLGNVITKNSGQEKLTHSKKKISDIFTILAILVVLSVLAGMFLGTSHPVGSSGYRMHCRITRISQIGLGLSMYAHDNPKSVKMFTFEEYDFYPEVSGDKGLHRIYKDYLENKDLYKCPKDKPVKKTFWEKTFGSSPKPEDSVFKSDFIYLGGFHIQEDPPIPILIDTIGNHEDYCNVVFSDEKTEYYEFKFSTYDDLIDAINKKKNYSKETMTKIKESLKKALENNKTDS